MMTFFPLEKMHRLFDGYIRPFNVAGHQLLLVQSEGVLHLIENRCPHMGAALTHATLKGNVLRCPSHGFEYDLRSGQPAREVFIAGGGRLRHFALAYEGNQVGIFV